jgi:hypothetical protein
MARTPGRDAPAVALEQDLELVQGLDRCGYDEAWCGEYHSAGTEQWFDYFQTVAAFPQMAVPGSNVKEMISFINDSGFVSNLGSHLAALRIGSEDGVHLRRKWTPWKVQDDRHGDITARR